MADDERVLCLYCKAGKEKSVVEHIHANDMGQAIFAQKTKRVLNKRTREWDEILAPLLPCYVFLYLARDDAGLRGQLYAMQNVLRILGYGEGRADYLSGRDLEFAQWLWRMEGRVDKLKVAEIGDRIEIIDSAFQSLRGTIRRVDRRKQTCLVELDAAGVIRELWLPYDMVKRLEQPADEER